MTSPSLDGIHGGDGFTAEMTGFEARRRPRMSIGVVAMLAVGIVSAAATIRSQPVTAKRYVASTAPSTALRAETAAVGASAI